MSPVFPGNTPPPQQAAEAAGLAEGTGTAAGSAAGTDAAVAESLTEAAEASDVLDATVTVGPTAYDQMLARLAELEATVAQLQTSMPSMPGIGHNNPPPLDIAELEEIKHDIASLKALPPPAPANANNIASKFVHFSERVLTWVGKQLVTFVTELMKASGKALGTTIGLSALWLTLGDQLTDSATAIMRWVTALLGQ
jgi:hypothetical protein